jgi:hypothetical protein
MSLGYLLIFGGHQEGQKHQKGQGTGEDSMRKPQSDEIIFGHVAMTFAMHFPLPVEKARTSRPDSASIEQNEGWD